MKEKYKQLYMSFAHNVAKLSHCKRLKVGCVIVNDDNLVYGYNGTPEGWNNCCETSENKTKEDVIHAEDNAIAKIATSPISSQGATVFITHAPCVECAKILARSGISVVYYAKEYRCSRGIEHLDRCGVKVEQYG